MITSVVHNFVRRRRLLLLVVGCCFFVTCLGSIFHLYRSTGGRGRRRFDQIISSYCNAPRQVDGGEETEAIDGLRLVQVQLLIRHGDRAPINTKALPNTGPVHLPCRFNHHRLDFKDKLATYKDMVSKEVFQIIGSEHKKLLEDRLSCYGGQLTPRGMLQHLFLGTHLKDSYPKFFTQIQNQDIHVLSTDTPRTKQSAAALLTGMLYNSFSSVTKGRAQKHKIALNVHADHLKAHLVLDKDEKPLSCPPLAKKFDEVVKGGEFVAFNKNIGPMVKSLAYYLSSDVSQLSPFDQIVDTFYTRSCHKLGVPVGPKYSVPSSLMEQAFGYANRFSTLKHSGELAEMQTLSLLSHIAKHIVSAVKDEDSHKKLVVYSGHDTMIHPFLRILDDKFDTWPPYASRIVFEVFVENGATPTDKNMYAKTFFRVLFNGDAIENIKFIGDAKGPMKLFPLSRLLTHLTQRTFDDVKKYEPSILKELLFAKIETMCSA